MNTANPINGAIYVESYRPAVRYERMLFGQFLEHFHRQVYGGVFDPGSPLADERGFRRDVAEALRELRVPWCAGRGAASSAPITGCTASGPTANPATTRRGAWKSRTPLAPMSSWRGAG